MRPGTTVESSDDGPAAPLVERMLDPRIRQHGWDTAPLVEMAGCLAAWHGPDPKDPDDCSSLMLWSFVATPETETPGRAR